MGKRYQKQVEVEVPKELIKVQVPLDLLEAFEEYAKAHYRSVPAQVRTEMVNALMRWARLQGKLRRELAEPPKTLDLEGPKWD